MTLGEDPAHQLRPPEDLLADQEERGRGAGARQRIQHRGRALGVRAVVEGERHPAGGGQRALQAQRARGGGLDGGERVADHAPMMATAPGRSAPDLDRWLPRPGLRVAHRRQGRVGDRQLWEAARAVRLADTATLGRLIRWRVPGSRSAGTFEELVRCAPFVVLEEAELSLVSGLVGAIWAVRPDLPPLACAQEFISWRRPGTARVLFAHCEVRGEAFGAQGRLGLAAIRPLVAAFGSLVGSEGIAAALRSVERDG